MHQHPPPLRTIEGENVLDFSRCCRPFLSQLWHLLDERQISLGTADGWLKWWMDPSYCIGTQILNLNNSVGLRTGIRPVILHFCEHSPLSSVFPVSWIERKCRCWRVAEVPFSSGFHFSFGRRCQLSSTLLFFFALQSFHLVMPWEQ